MIAPEVSILLVNYRTADLTLACLRSITEKVKGVPYEVIVADNASGDGSAERIEWEHPDVNLIRLPRNRGFGSGCNAAANAARGRLLFFLNTDTILEEDSPAKLAAFLHGNPKAVGVGCQLYNPDKSPQLSAANFPNLARIIAGRDKAGSWVHALCPPLGRYIAYAPPQRLLKAPLRVDWCTGAALMIREEAYRAVNGFDEDYFLYAEEMDLCQRLSVWGEIWFTPETGILHLDGGSAAHTLDADRMARIAAGHRLYFKKHLPGPQAWIYTHAWRLSARLKALGWTLAAFFSGKQSFRNKAAWQAAFAANFFRLEYPLPE